MIRTTAALLVLVIAGYPALLLSADDRALAAERREAQKQRQLQKNERGRQNREASVAFREYTRDLKRDYQERVRSKDTEYRLHKAEFKAERNMKIAQVEADMQQNMTRLFLNPVQSGEQASIDKLKADMDAYSNKVFAIKKESALQEHEEFINNETAKHELLTERDKQALEKAKSLGLTQKPAPILAKPIGGALTRQEEQWNKREQKEVERMHKNNMRQLAEFTNGKELREWEIANKREDFKLEWDKKSELHALKSEQQFYTSLMSGAAGGDAQARQQELTKKFSEISRRTREINIQYKLKHDKNRIKRREQRRQLMGY